MQNLQLMVYTHPAKVGPRVYNVPYSLDGYAQYRLPLNWYNPCFRPPLPLPLACSRVVLSPFNACERRFIRRIRDTRGGESTQQRMEREFRDVLKKRSVVLQKKMDVYKTCLENRAFMHFRWLY
jgi:hypothetical protein